MWCIDHSVPAILMSESQYSDSHRRWWKEYTKHCFVNCFSAGLVGGTPQKEYLAKLGMERWRIFFGYDVVDNSHFYVGSSSARKNAHYLRRCLNLPENYFLSSCRFIEKKNILSLLQAYRVYIDRFLQNSWSLVILGDGELKSEIIASISRLGLQKFVFLPGFKQYSELPNYYGLARAFVLASTSEQWGLVVNEAMASCLPVLVSERCGCARDLVVDGKNGYRFDPFDVNYLADLMGKITQSNVSLMDMGRASNDIISQFGTDYFAKGLIRSATTAINDARSKIRKFDKLILKLFMLIREHTRGK